MKSLIVLFITGFLLLQCVGCKKETVEQAAAPKEAVEPVIDPKETIEQAMDTTTDELITITGEIIIENLTWIFPWYNSIEVRDFSSMLPTDTFFKIFIQRDNSSQWKRVPLISNDSNPGTKYEYFVERRTDGAGMYNFGSLYIFYYGNDVSDNPSVKIQY